jgi:hypothetical protein
MVNPSVFEDNCWSGQCQDESQSPGLMMKAARFDGCAFNDNMGGEKHTEMMECYSTGLMKRKKL